MGKEDKNHFKLPKPYEKAPISTHKSTANLAAAPEHRASNEAKAMVSNEQNDNHLSSNYNQLGNNQFHNRQAFKNNRHRLYNNQVHSSNIYSSLVHPSLVYKRHASHDTQNSTPAGRCPFNNTEGAFSASAIFGQRARGIPFKTHTEKDLSRGPLFNQVLNATFFANHVSKYHGQTQVKDRSSPARTSFYHLGRQYHYGAHYKGILTGTPPVAFPMEKIMEVNTIMELITRGTLAGTLLVDFPMKKTTEVHTITELVIRGILTGTSLVTFPMEKTTEGHAITELITRGILTGTSLMAFPMEETTEGHLMGSII